MRKSIILAVVVVVALVVAGTSGVFATWSDSETSQFNYISTGSLDLKVNGADDLPYGTGVPSKVFIECMTPCHWYYGGEAELWHAGQCDTPALAYIHFMDYWCFNILPKVNPEDPADGGSDFWPRGETTGYVCPETGALKPEPELVAEFGGWVDSVYVEGLQRAVGDTCSMAAAVECWVVDEAGNTLIPPTLMQDLYCREIPLFELKPCEPRMIYLYFKLHQFSEEDFFGEADFILDPWDADFPDPEVDPRGYEAAYMHWLKFNDWPSWAYMRDAVSFNMEFDILLDPFVD
jgi:predicted ribosomally synthesized peptide with SipW-like signal peptide